MDKNSFLSAFSFSLLLSCLMVGHSFAESNVLVFEADHKNRIVVHGNMGEDESLFFGDDLSHALHWDFTSDVFLFTDNVSFSATEITNVRLESLAGVPACNSSSIGKIYYNEIESTSLVCDGTVLNILENQGSFNGEVPFVSDVSPFSLSPNNSTTLLINGTDFIPSTTVSIPSFTGTISSFSVLSTSQISIDLVTAGVGVFDIVLSNNGVLNSLWSGNGEGMIIVQ